MNSIKSKARRAGALYFLFLIVGLVDMKAFSHFLVAGDSAATARNILNAELTYRIGILTQLGTLVLFIFLIASLYNLLKDVDKWHSLVMLLLVTVGVAIGLASLPSKIAPLILLSRGDYFSVFTKAQLDSLALGFLNLGNWADTIDTAFWGLWLFPFGILVIKSRFFPRVLGILLIVAGFAYLTISVTSIVLPEYEDLVTKVMMPLGLGEFPIIFWLLIKGARPPQQSATPAASVS